MYHLLAQPQQTLTNSDISPKTVPRKEKRKTNQSNNYQTHYPIIKQWKIIEILRLVL